MFNTAIILRALVDIDTVIRNSDSAIEKSNVLIIANHIFDLNMKWWKSSFSMVEDTLEFTVWSHLAVKFKPGITQTDEILMFMSAAELDLRRCADDLDCRNAVKEFLLELHQAYLAAIEKSFNKDLQEYIVQAQAEAEREGLLK